MLEVAQAFTVIVGGSIGVIVLGWILVLVRRQSKQLEKLENQMKLKEAARKREIENG